MLRWQADADLRRSWADDAPRPAWSELLIGDDGLGWRRCIHPEDLADYESALRAVLGTDGRSTVDYRVVIGPDRVVDLREELTGEDSGPPVLSGAAMDVTDVREWLRRDETRLADHRAFDELARRLGSASAMDELVTTLSDHSQAVMGAMNIAALLTRDERQNLSVYQGPHPAQGTTTLRVVEFTDDTPAGLAAMTGVEAFYTDHRQFADRFPRLAQRMGDDEILSAAAIPVGDPAEPDGAIWFRWPTRVVFDGHLVEVLRRTAAAFGTAVRHLEEVADRDHQMTELLQTNRELESISAVAAHDLKAPLRRVHSFLQLLEEELGTADANAVAVRYAGIIREQIDGMGRLIEDLLQYSATSRPDIESVDIDLGEVIDEVESVLEPAITAEGAVIERGDLPRLRGDETLIEQLFNNLVANAVKYRHPDRAPRISISAAREPGDERTPVWDISVTDNGAGIDSQLHEKIFEIFDRGAVIDQEGTGIGLAIVKRIAERHDGRVWVVSEVGEGSTFHVTLPGAPPAEAV